LIDIRFTVSLHAFTKAEIDTVGIYALEPFQVKTGMEKDRKRGISRFSGKICRDSGGSER
jgi:hypothetical protein